MTLTLANTHPHLADQWHATMNGNTDIQAITQNSHKKIWWTCPEGHDWLKSVQERVAGVTCKYCSGKSVLAGFNDLATTHPQIATQWHPLLNDNLKPTQFVFKSREKIYWLGPCQHSWSASIRNRAELLNGCPYCANRTVLPMFNDLATTNPELAAEWHPIKNGCLTPESVMAGSAKKVWWLDSFNHEWEAELRIRARGTGCPVCSGHKTVKGYNDLASTNPKLAAEWHPTKNKAITPDNVTKNSAAAVWWLCANNHAWQATVNNRSRGRQCGVCSGRLTAENVNDLATTHPEIAAQWHPTLNHDVQLTQVSKSSDKKVWWVCSKGHDWEAWIYHVTAGQTCNICLNKKLLQGFNDLAAINPKLASEWHLTRNGTLHTSDVMSGSGLSVWWECAEGHEWKAVISSRLKGSGCGRCSAIAQTSKAENAIAAFLTELNIRFLQSDHSILGKQELDLYIPDKNFAIEFNGVYWHSEAAGKDRNYHYNKWLACKIQGIQLIQIWEDDWKRNPDQIKRSLAYKLGVSAHVKIFARKTQPIIVTTIQARLFLEQNHIQGFASGTYYVGLKDVQGILRALIVLKKEVGNTLNIIRYATAGSVTGGFTKLLTYATKTYQPDSYITFSDHTISDGGLYENNGFVTDKEIPPDYMYVVKGQRKHKFGYRLKKFRTDPDLLWEENLSERELAILNNLPRIWDAGKTRWVKPI